MEIKDRIMQLIAALGVKTSAFEKQLSLSNGYFRNVKSVAADTCRKIVELYPNVSLKWLVCGKGDMFLNSPTSEATQSNQGIKNDIHGNGSIEVLNIGENADVDSPKNITPDSGILDSLDFEEMAEHLLHDTELQEEIKRKDSEIRELKARLEESYKTIELLKSLLVGQK